LEGGTMSGEERIRAAMVSLETDQPFSEAVLLLRDGSRLCFRHTVSERWAKAVAPDEAQSEVGVAGEVLSLISMFRLNAKHLDVQFTDGSRWEWRFRQPTDGG
jgi:hypothetical protein